MKAIREAAKKLKASTALFLISFIGIGISIVFLVLDIVGIVEEIFDSDILSRILVAVLFVVSFAFLIVSMLLNVSYRKSCAEPGKLSMFMYVMGWIFLFPVMLFIFVALLISGGSLAFTGSDELMKVTVKDEKGNVYKLTQTFIDSNEFRDQNGDLWKTTDNGVTFERVDIKATDDDGNEKTLTHTYDSMLTQHYQDQEGEEWKSRDGGQTFEHIVTKAKVKDADGNEYELRAIQAGLDNFIDQNGDMWTTYDGGKTFERR